MNYDDTAIPADKDPEDYTYTERRSDIAQLIVEAGHPDRVSRTQLADYYGVAPSTITRDIEKIKNEIKDQIADDAQFITEAFYRKAIKVKIDEEKWMEANTLIKDWNDWLFDTGKQQKIEHDDEETPSLAEQWAQNLQDEDSEAIMQTADDTAAESVADSDDGPPLDFESSDADREPLPEPSSDG